MAIRTNIPQFNREIGRTATRLSREVDIVVKAVARAVAFTVIDATPVDTGEARSNWLVSLGTPIRGTVAPYTPYPKFSMGNGQGISESANAAKAKDRAIGAITRRPLGQSIVIQNNVDHIEELNAGSSRQAPALFVELAVSAGIRTLNQARIRL